MPHYKVEIERPVTFLSLKRGHSIGMEELPRKEILQSLPIIPNAERERKCLGLTYKQFEQMLLKEANFAKPI